MASGALPQTLKSITAVKINELSKQRALFDQRKAEILAAAEAAPDLRTRARALLDGLSRLKGYPLDSLDRDDMDLDIALSEEESGSESDEVTTPGMGQLLQADHTNIRRFFLQGRYDPSISESLLREWIAQLEADLHFLELKHDHASFFSKLVTEWLSHLDDSTVSEKPEAGDSTSASSQIASENVGRAEMHEQRAQWESLVFEADSKVDEASIKAYLDKLFLKNALSRQALKELRENVQRFAAEMTTAGEWLTVDDLRWVSKAVLKADQLTPAKTSILKEFMRNEDVLQEVADVLNMRLASLDTWSWGEEGIPVEMRRQLNGKYRVFMDAELLDSLLLQFLGTKWAVELRQVFESFHRSHAWTSVDKPVSKGHLERRKYFLGHDSSAPMSISDLRRSIYDAEYFMTQLPESITEGSRSYDDNAEVKNALDLKHSLLHMLITESLFQKDRYGQFTAIRSDYQWFGPSLPHVTILTVLKYFGVPDTWLSFFKVYLEAPLKFIHDGPAASPRSRKRGVPMSQTLSDVFGESVLFCMDYAVNQHTEGGILYRLHDDFWFWGAEETCEAAWVSMTQYARVMGLQFNMEKTGTVRMGAIKPQQESALPVGDIRWGFLVLDAEQGRFVIDQAQVDLHIEELDRQLSACNSVFTWVEAWNGYFGRFFTNNFARPAMCFGRDHIDITVSTLSRIERTLFTKYATQTASTGEIGVTGYLRSVISERFGVENLPEGFFYYPVELGGLGLLNPYIRLLAMRENIKQTPQRLLKKATIAEEMEYRVCKERFEKLGPRSSKTMKDEDGQPASFISFEEYMQYAERYSTHFMNAYRELCRVPEEKGIAATASFIKNQAGLKPGKSDAISTTWKTMTPYWRWVAELYHDEMVRTYGSLAAVNRELMPLGVVKTLKEGRFRWQG
ncbi:hypothetical protein POX_c03631 [Penicillium oxalicum]|uniref:Reverse transcriptase domain-containing protein n=1 Tax=Penicillium oxalicum (strain 114-2 / CGMCC 5302) TaxID=933388 RepID=S8ATS1_PENO1|nr:hypothetical protein POX_c03631 [Penicillium oxalicum]EPS25227.1 hypothetical protein PDE_00160 [Penicillium oxalicum 114-2]KAI2790782.1 hypothetical protein POX_c03631 [Penicillium oxalicum]